MCVSRAHRGAVRRSLTQPTGRLCRIGEDSPQGAGALGQVALWALLPD